MIGIVVTTHGPLAYGLIESLRFFSGDMSCISSVVLNNQDSPELFQRHLEEAVKSVDQNQGVVILTDILGGTPFNQSMMLALKRNDVKVITGVNLMMLIEAVLSRSTVTDLDAFASRIVHTAKESISDVTNQYQRGSVSDLDDVDEMMDE